jgi:hypothetical protein
LGIVLVAALQRLFFFAPKQQGAPTMTKLTALSPTLHKHLRIDTDKLEAQGASERLVPVVITEFSKLVVQYPIVFTKSEDSGEFVCVAVLGFEPNENLFWQRQSWQGIYIPLQVLRQPFFVGKDQGQNVICIDEQGSSISHDHGFALFDDMGGETEFLRDIKKMLAQLLQAERETKEFTRTLVEYDLLLAMPLEITFTNGETRSVRGFYTIDEAKLEKLPADQLLGLQKEKYLTPLHMIIASTGHFYSLIHMKNARLSHSQNP